MILTVRPVRALKIEVSWFQESRFASWHRARRESGLATWCPADPATLPGIEFQNDTFVVIGGGRPGGGSDPDMPEPYWTQLVALAARNNGGSLPEEETIVWITEGSKNT